MSKKETNKLLSITNISKTLNILRATRQKAEQSGPSVSQNIRLSTTHITSNTVSYPVTTPKSYTVR